MAAVEPKFALRRQPDREPPLRQPLHARRPVDAEHAGLEGRAGQFQAAHAQRRDRRAGVLELVAPVKFRRRQIEQPIGVLIDQAPALFGRRPVLPGNAERRPHPRSLPLDDGQRLVRLARNHRRHAVLENAGFLGGDFFHRVAEEVMMIHRQAGNHARQRTFDDVGGVEPAAEADFEENNIGRTPREQQKRRGRLHFEHRDRRVAVLGFAVCQRSGERVVVDKLAAARVSDAEALVEANQIGRGIDMHALLRRLEDGAHEGDSRTFAVGAGDMNQRRQLPLGMAERRQEPLDAIEREVDPLRMQRQQPRMNRADRGGAGTRRGHAGAGRL